MRTKHLQKCKMSFIKKGKSYSLVKGVMCQIAYVRALQMTMNLTSPG